MKLQRLREEIAGIGTSQMIAIRVSALTEILESYEELLALLKVSACPCCDGQGAFYDGRGQVCQCQFCDERSKAIKQVQPCNTPTK